MNTTMTARPTEVPQSTRTNRMKFYVCSEGGWRYRKVEGAIERAKSQAKLHGEPVKVMDVDAGTAFQVTPTGRIVDGNSVKVGDAKRPYYYKTIGGFSAENQLRVNRARVLVEGSRCKVKGVRGKFVFQRYVKNGDKTWAEVREIETDRFGVEHVTRFRAFRPEQLTTAPGWNK